MTKHWQVIETTRTLQALGADSWMFCDEYLFSHSNVWILSKNAFEPDQRSHENPWMKIQKFSFNRN